MSSATTANGVPPACQCSTASCVPRRLRRPVKGSVMLAWLSLPILSCKLEMLFITARFKRSASKYQALTDCTRCMATATS
ncbi:hypothetical protein D3C81_2015070 [compost metagenome]